MSSFEILSTLGHLVLVTFHIGQMNETCSPFKGHMLFQA